MGASLSSVSSEKHPFNCFIFQPPNIKPENAGKLNTHNLVIESASGEVPVFHCADESKPAFDRRCIIFSHGNAADLQSVKEYESLHILTGIDVIAYDYNGYGYTRIDPTKKPHQNACVDNLAGVVSYCTIYGYEPHNIILLGQSIGSGVVMNYAYKYQGTYGRIILMSPMKSIATLGENYVGSTLSNSVPRFCDLFTSYKYVESVETPIFIIHGTKDTLIPVKHGQFLYETHKQIMRRKGLSHRVYPALWIENAEHNDVINYMGWEGFCGHIKKFCDF